MWFIKKSSSLEYLIEKKCLVLKSSPQHTSNHQSHPLSTILPSRFHPAPYPSDFSSSRSTVNCFSPSNPPQCRTYSHQELEDKENSRAAYMRGERPKKLQENKTVSAFLTVWTTIERVEPEWMNEWMYELISIRHLLNYWVKTRQLLYLKYEKRF